MVSDLAQTFRDGVLLRREALTLGIDDKSLSRSVRAGVLERIRQGAYADRASWIKRSPDDRHRLLSEAVLRLYGPNVVLSHASAVLAHRGPSWGLDLTSVNISHVDGNGRTQGRVHHHFGSHRDDDVIRADGHRVTGVARAIVQTTIQSGRTEAGVVLASHFLHRRVVSFDDLSAARLEVGDTPGALTLRSALAYADGRLESVAEARCWFVLAPGSQTTIVPQYPVCDEQGIAFAYLDFALPDLGVFVEVDGREKYYRHRRTGESMEDYLLRERQRENRVREVTGWEAVRLTWADLARPDQIRERIRRVAERHGKPRPY